MRLGRRQCSAGFLALRKPVEGNARRRRVVEVLWHHATPSTTLGQWQPSSLSALGPLALWPFTSRYCRLPEEELANALYNTSSTCAGTGRLKQSHTTQTTCKSCVYLYAQGTARRSPQRRHRGREACCKRQMVMR